ncbi:MAG TPA: toxin-antitoxin system HicB family antitoxin [Thermoanaerobaculia bacterium]|nr:toxin-antitoxin system HicB family antitoxin [Thermoanaerobaculia bacterium]
MATLSIRLPDSIHRHLKDLAKKEKVSINQLISTAVAEKMSALMTEDYLEALARDVDPAAFDRVLAKVPAVPPDPWDRWDEEKSSAEEEPEKAGSSSRKF